ncbi:hypothetical protein FB554_1829 [Barrientosiimonas humi]|uniref:Uncharacterized protein n=1 Tax=Barrientosiimonas humi TaxID=999931 RepID=A0A542XCX6_9MICO|nr:hypothetical protein [Barrientosiimonas humi]TQL33678.1 hypothetical protein FB554_1829 [Barrientosiimonas humi]CAG7573665.1 hypothetical protein BH39T_PBIAJDOK_02303 [Barrientosiimonas humi]
MSNSYSANPVELQGSSRARSGGASALEGLPGDLLRLLRGLGDAAGDPDVAATAGSVARTWQGAGGRLVGEAGALARTSGQSADDYERADATQVRRFRVAP